MAAAGTSGAGRLLARPATPVPPRVALRAYLQLVRPANLVTALADVLAGYAAGGLAGWGELPWLMAATLLLYGGGVCLNDFFDRDLDAAERPERPIPSGRASAGGAAILGGVLLAAGIACAFRGSAAGGTLACGIAAAAVIYDARAKHYAVAGPLCMGSCRGLNVLLGVSANPALLVSRWYLGLISLVYIAGVTALSAGEVHGARPGRTRGAAALVVVAVAGVLALGLASPFRAAAALLPLALLAWRIGPALYRACRRPEARHIRAAVKAGIVSLVFLDAAIAAGYAGLGYASLLVALVLLVSWLARRFPVT